MIRRWFILGTLAVALIGLLWFFYREVVAYSPVEKLERAEAGVREEQMPAGPYRGFWSSEIVEKNLFGRLRGYAPPPPPPSAQDIPEVKPVPPSLNLSGIILDRHGEFAAFIQMDGGPPREVREGDVFDGVLVVKISERDVKLLWNEEEINLSMKKIQTLPGPAGPGARPGRR